MKAETVEARAVKIAARIMVAAGLCRYENDCECKRAYYGSTTCERCIRSWLTTKAKVELSREGKLKHGERASD